MERAKPFDKSYIQTSTGETGIMINWDVSWEGQLETIESPWYIHYPTAKKMMREILIPTLFLLKTDQFLRLTEI